MHVLKEKYLKRCHIRSKVRNKSFKVNHRLFHTSIIGKMKNGNFSNSSRVWSKDVRQIIINLSEYFLHVTVFSFNSEKNSFVEFEETEARVFLKIKFIFYRFIFTYVIWFDFVQFPKIIMVCILLFELKTFHTPSYSYYFRTFTYICMTKHF